MLCLTERTSPGWVEIALADLDAVLVDHAHCEIKAAQNALSLAVRAQDAAMAQALADLAEEEVRHFRQVLDVLTARGLSLGVPPADAYAAELRQAAHKTRPNGRTADDTLLDRLLVAALIEARSCERFRLLADRLAERGDAELAAFYEELFAAEARHYRVLFDLAARSAGGDDRRVRGRLAELANEEAAICRKLGESATVHG